MPGNIIVILFLWMFLILGGCTKHGHAPHESTFLQEVTIGLINWPASRAYPINDMKECLARKIAGACVRSKIVDQEIIRELLFPYLEPATQPETEDAFTTLLEREDVHARLSGKGMNYLVGFSFKTQVSDPNGWMECGRSINAAGCVGFVWFDKDTRIDVDIWEIDELNKRSHIESRAEGTIWIPAYYLPVPIPARTETHACQQMSHQVVEYIRSQSQSRFCR